MRFVDAEAVFNHSLIRVGFMESWEKLIPAQQRESFFEKAISKIEQKINREGSFEMSIPVLYLAFEKEAI